MYNGGDAWEGEMKCISRDQPCIDEEPSPIELDGAMLERAGLDWCNSTCRWGRVLFLHHYCSAGGNCSNLDTCGGLLSCDRGGRFEELVSLGTRGNRNVLFSSHLQRVTATYGEICAVMANASGQSLGRWLKSKR